MNILHSIILGLIQGLTEFLPISSSGHLIIMPWLFGWKSHPLIFDIILHAGTLFAIIIYFRRDWIKILREKRRLFWYIIIASVPGIIFGGMFGERIESCLRDPMPVALVLGIFGLVLYLSELYGRKNKSLRELTLMAAVLIGIFQMLAVIPGVSRSGITVSAALFLGMNRESSVRFSFLLGAPIIFAAACYGIRELLQLGLGAGGPGGINQFLSWPAVLAGLFASFLTGIIAIHFLLRYVKRHPFNIFAVYRLAVSVIIITVLFCRG